MFRKLTTAEQYEFNLNRAMKLSKVCLFKMEQANIGLNRFILRKDTIINRKKLSKKKFSY